MYHHVNSDRCSNDLTIFEEHLKYISEHFNAIFPDEKVEGRCVCLTFDDAYADFYLLIFPLLKKYNLKALLAVPSSVILQDTNSKTRLNYEHNDLFDHYQEGTFCTFAELRIMVDSGLIQIASHSRSHVDITSQGVDLAQEIAYSKKILEDALHVKVKSFVFPFGKYNQEVLKEVKKHYQFAFRIGNAIHKDFNGINGVIYRVDGDNLKNPDEIFSPLKLLKYRFKGIVKGLGKR